MIGFSSMVYNEDCVVGAKTLQENNNGAVNVVITSPPYAEQRKNSYGGVNENDYPRFTVEWMESIKPLLTDDGSVFIIIRPHIKNGQISDYVLKTRLALREAGWVECEEIIWIKPDSAPLGSVNRPRRAWEHILWFSKTPKPYVDVKKGGNESNRIGFENDKFEHGGKSHIHGGQNKSKQGKARVRDYIECGTGKVEKGHSHPAMYPRELVKYLIDLACPSNGVVLDPFMGSGTTARECISNNVGFLGFEKNEQYYLGCIKSLKHMIDNENKQELYQEFCDRYEELAQ